MIPIMTIAARVVIRHFLVFKLFLLVFTAGSGGNYRRTRSRTDRWVAHASRVLVSDLSTLAETRANREKFAMARTPSPAREMRALPNPQKSERIRKRLFDVSSSVLLIEREV